MANTPGAQPRRTTHALATCVIRADPTLMPVGTMFQRTLDKHDRELEERIRPLLLGPDRWAAISSLVRHALTVDLRVAPAVPPFPAGRWLLSGIIIAELLRTTFRSAFGISHNMISSSPLMAIVLGLATARILNKYKCVQRRHLVIATLILLRCTGLSIVFAPTLFLASVFTIGPPPLMTREDSFISFQS